MKKALLCILFLLFLKPVHADVLIEPEDSFYRKHADQCTSERKYYEASVDVQILKNPDARKGFTVAETGSIFYISWVYTDSQGNQWGLYDGRNVTYWIEMDDLVPVYSRDEFFVDYQSEIKSESITFNPEQTGFVILYEYPGSTWISDVLKTEWISEGSFTVNQTYVDDHGQKWGYMPYYMQHNGWVNLDDAVVQNEPEIYSPVVFIPDKLPAETGWVAAAAIGVCTLTGLMIFIKFKKRN